MTQPTAAGHFVLYPGYSSRPSASSLNFTPGQTRAHNAVVPLNAHLLPGDYREFGGVVTTPAEAFTRDQLVDQHHTGQLVLLLRRGADIGVDWLGTRDNQPAPPTW